MELVSGIAGGAVTGLGVVLFLIAHTHCFARKRPGHGLIWGFGLNEDVSSSSYESALNQRIEALERSVAELHKSSVQ